MFKRVLALFLCVVMLAGFVSCTSLKHGIFDKGAYIRAYLTNPIYDFDPLAAFDNEDNLRIVSMMFVGLFRADDNGKPKKDLVDKYKYKEDKKRGEYTLTLYLKKTQWSDGVYVNAGDAQYAFLRLFDSETSHPATALFYDIKNARKIISGDASIDDLGVSVIDPTTLEFKFERPIDLDTFLTALCSPAVYPVRADIVEGKPNWAKRVSTTVCSGPFLLREINYGSEDGFVLERNSYYMRDRQKDDLDKAVRPYRIIVNYLTDHAEQIATLNSGEVGALQYIGYVPLGMRTDASLKKAKVTDAPSTFSLYLNENALIGGTALFAKTEVRQALSEAVDRNALVEAVTYAKAADGLVPWTVPERAGVRKDFRKKADSYLSASGDIEGAKSKLAAAGVNPANYSFSIAVRKEDPDHVAMVEAVAAAWRELGFRVTVRQLSNYEIMDKNDEGNWVGTGMYSSHYTEALDAGDFEVIALDVVATAPDAFAVLAPFAKEFSGNATVLDEAINPTGALTPHITGYDSADYNAKIQAAYEETKPKKRAALLHEAEAMLMNDLPVIPLVYNQNVSLSSKKLKKVKSDFYNPAVFTKAKLSGYWDIALAEGFVEEKNDEEE